jgi:glutamate synthase domain-containing protein 2
MTDGPDRIYIDRVHGRHPEDWNWTAGDYLTKKERAQRIEYVRADALAAMQAATRQAQASLLTSERHNDILSGDLVAMQARVAAVENAHVETAAMLHTYMRIHGEAQARCAALEAERDEAREWRDAMINKNAELKRTLDTSINNYGSITRERHDALARCAALEAALLKVDPYSPALMLRRAALKGDAP